MEHLEKIRVAFSTKLPASVNDRIRTLMREGADGQTLISALTTMLKELPSAYEAERPQPQRDSTIRAVSSMGITAGL